LRRISAPNSNAERFAKAPHETAFTTTRFADGQKGTDANVIASDKIGERKVDDIFRIGEFEEQLPTDEAQIGRRRQRHVGADNVLVPSQDVFQLRILDFRFGQRADAHAPIGNEVRIVVDVLVVLVCGFDLLFFLFRCGFRNAFALRNQYKAIFDYFDARLVGLTATPKGEVDRDTYRLFDLETGVPTDAYGLDEAVRDKHLVPPRAISLTTDFLDRGIAYDNLSEEDKEKWDALEWDEDGGVPDAVEAPALNKWLFNADTVDRVLKTLMEMGQKVEDVDRLGKTIIFAKNSDHAHFITKRFDIAYPHLAGHFARTIECSIPYAQSLIDDFSIAAKAPHIAVSIDMLDTGVDVPEVVNLVFFKPVRSKTKFWQMIGRGTRLCKDVFGPGRDKAFFYVFDWCRNFEFFNEHPGAVDGTAGESLTKRLFEARVALVGQIDAATLSDDEAGRAVVDLRGGLASGLREEVRGMSPDNFLVRPHRRFVERFSVEDAWARLDADVRQDLSEHVAGLPTSVTDDDLAAKQFDLTIFRAQLALLQAEAAFAGLKKRICDLASLLEGLANVPMVAAELDLIQEIQTEAFWQDVTLPMLETVRRRLRALIKLIELKKRPVLYSDFEDATGAISEIEVRGIPIGTDMEAFRRKARVFLRPHENHISVLKLRRNESLTPSDLAELERIFTEAGVDSGSLDQLRQDGGLGRFVRSLVGLDREAAQAAFAEFLNGRKLTGDQHEFMSLVIEHLTATGVMDPKLLYEAPFTDFDDQGVSGVFPKAEVIRLVEILRDIERRSVA
jgi:type I restriction enzyme R subunit